MIQAQTKLTSQGQVSVPASVRRLLGLTPGASLEWQETGDGRVFVQRAAAHDTLAAHRALFCDVKPASNKPKPKTLTALKQGIVRHIRARHARP